MHNQYTLPGVSVYFSCGQLLDHVLTYYRDVIKLTTGFSFSQGSGPIQVRYADGEREHHGINFATSEITGFVRLLDDKFF